MPSEIPMPLSVAFNPSILRGLSRPALGAYTTLIVSFWADQIEIPEDDARMMALAGCYTRQWVDVKRDVRLALQRVLPNLATVYAEVKEKRARITSQAKYAISCRKYRPAKRENGRFVPLSEVSKDTLPVVPAPKQTFHNNKTDLDARSAAVKREQKATKPGSLRDRSKGGV